MWFKLSWVLFLPKYFNSRNNHVSSISSLYHTVVDMQIITNQTINYPKCSDCKFYIPAKEGSFVYLPKCRFYKKTQLVEGFDTIDHPHCIKSRLFDEYCGKEGRNFQPAKKDL